MAKGRVKPGPPADGRLKGNKAASSSSSNRSSTASSSSAPKTVKRSNIPGTNVRPDSMKQVPHPVHPLPAVKKSNPSIGS